MYYYDRFDPKHYDLFAFPGPKPGSSADDFTVFDLTANKVKLSDYRGKWLVIETGSITCNMYTRNINKMNALAKKYPDVEFVVVYVREAHPGSKLPQHSSLKDKQSIAACLSKTCNEQRSILVDDMKGSMHRHYGEMPNIIYVINPDGEVIYRHNWGNAEELDLVLENREQRYTNEYASTWELQPFGYNTTIQLFKSVGRGGWDAIWDLVKSMPSIVWEHLKTDLKARHNH